MQLLWRGVKNFCRWWSLDRFVSVATLSGIALAVIVYYGDVEQRKEDLVAMELQQIISAWTVLTRKAPFDLGKSVALRILINHGQNLDYLDLSCDNMGGESCKLTDSGGAWGAQLSNISFSPSEKLDSSPVFASYGMDFSGSTMKMIHAKTAIINNASFRDSFLWLFGFEDSTFIDTDFANSIIKNSIFEELKFQKPRFYNSKLTDVQFNKVNFYHADFRMVELLNVTFSNVQVSRSTFSGLKILDKGETTQFIDAWAWDDQPPVDFPKDFEYKSCKFNEGIHNRLERPMDCFSPRPLPE